MLAAVVVVLALASWATLAAHLLAIWLRLAAALLINAAGVALAWHNGVAMTAYAMADVFGVGLLLSWWQLVVSEDINWRGRGDLPQLLVRKRVPGDLPLGFLLAHRFRMARDHDSMHHLLEQSRLRAQMHRIPPALRARSYR